MKLGWLISAAVFYFCFLLTTFYGLYSGVRFFELTSISVLSLHERTGFPQGNLFFILLALAFLLCSRVNVIVSALASTLAYMTLFYFDKTYIFSNLNGAIIYEFPGHLWRYSPLPNSDYLYFLALGKFIQFLALLTVLVMCFRALCHLKVSNLKKTLLGTNLKQLFQGSVKPMSQLAFQESKLLVADPKQEKLK